MRALLAVAAVRETPWPPWVRPAPSKTYLVPFVKEGFRALADAARIWTQPRAYFDHLLLLRTHDGMVPARPLLRRPLPDPHRRRSSSPTAAARRSSPRRSSFGRRRGSCGPPGTGWICRATRCARGGQRQRAGAAVRRRAVRVGEQLRGAAGGVQLVPRLQRGERARPARAGAAGGPPQPRRVPRLRPARPPLLRRPLGGQPAPVSVRPSVNKITPSLCSRPL